MLVLRIEVMFVSCKDYTEGGQAVQLATNAFLPH